MIINGATMRFDILATEDPTLISELDKCIANSVGGIRSITAEVYAEELKKKATGNLSGSSFRPKPHRQELTPSQWEGQRAVGAVSNGAGQFASPQLPNGRDHAPRNQFGLGARQAAPAAAPEPIEVPSAESFQIPISKPPTAKLNAVKVA